MSPEQLQEKLLDKIWNKGRVVVVREHTTREILGLKFNYSNLSVTSGYDEAYTFTKFKEVELDVKRCISLLESNPNSRQAVLTFNVESVNGELPNCLVSVQFLYRDEKLNTMVFQRSLDVKNKLLGDIALINKLSNYVALYFDWKTGKTTWFVGSAHIYAF